MRQSGIIAAGGLYALRHNLDRLADDHRRAKDLAVALAESVPDRVDADQVETNIVMLEVSDAPRFVGAAGGRGVLLGAVSPTVIRAVTHLDVDDDQLDAAKAVLCPMLEEDAKRPHPVRPC